MTDVLNAAHDYARRGWGIVPLYGMDGDDCRCGRGSLCPPKTRGKHPSLGNAWQKNTITTGADVQVWYEDHPHDNVGIATGADSGLWVLDVDGAEGIRTVTDLTREHGALPPTRIVRTGSGGLHYYWTAPAGFEPRNSTSWIGPGIDIRGRGGQVVAPPSISGRGSYDVMADHPVADAPDWLLALVREHATMSAAGANAQVKSAEHVDVEFIPPRLAELASTLVDADAGRFRHFHAIVAASFEAGYSQGQTVTIVAPWCVAVEKFVGRIEAEVARSWAKLEIEAAKTNDWVDGIAGPQTPAPGPQAPTQPATAGSTALVPQVNPEAVAEADEDADDGPLIEPTWRPVDLQPFLDGTYVPEAPSLMPRSDGQALLYPGRVHSLHGESESGKSLVAQAECARLLLEDRGVLYIDFESDAAAVVARLMEMGVPPEVVGTAFTYLRPENDPRKFAHEREELFAVLRHHHELIVIDGVTDALGIFGAGSGDNDEIAAFMRTFPRMLARKTSAAVVLIDHVTKDADSRGRYALGGQAKMNALDGSAFVVEIVEPLGRGMRGVVSLRVAKDRPGGVRPHAGPFRKTDRTQEAARVVVDSTSGDRIDVTVEAPNHAGETAPTARGGFRPTVRKERVSDFLERATAPVSWNVIKDGVRSNREHLKSAVSILAAEGFIEVTTGARNASMHRLERRYDANADPLSDTYTGWFDGSETTESDDRGQPGPDRGQNQSERPGPTAPLSPIGGPGQSGPGPVTEATTGATPSNLDGLSCNQCGEEWLAEVIHDGHGLCPECVR